MTKLKHSSSSSLMKKLKRWRSKDALRDDDEDDWGCCGNADWNPQELPAVEESRVHSRQPSTQLQTSTPSSPTQSQSRLSQLALEQELGEVALMSYLRSEASSRRASQRTSTSGSSTSHIPLPASPVEKSLPPLPGPPSPIPEDDVSGPGIKGRQRSKSLMYPSGKRPSRSATVSAADEIRVRHVGGLSGDRSSREARKYEFI